MKKKKMMRRIPITLTFILIIFSVLGNAQPAPISGNLSICQGGFTPLSDTSSSGVWSSNNVSVASVGASTGIVTALAPGTAVISYTTGSGSVTAQVTVNALPAADSVTGGGIYCSGTAGPLVGLNNSSPGISYGLFEGSFLVNTLTSIGGSLSFGHQTGTGTYTVVATNPATGCSAPMSGSAFVTVNPTPSPIRGSSALCPGVSYPLSDSTSGGAWSISNASLATFNVVSGTLTPSAAGTINITYALATGCVTVLAATINPAPAIITGTSSVCSGIADTLCDGTTGGTWSSSNVSVATINSVNGIITTTGPGSATISYNASGCIVSKIISVGSSPTLHTVTGGGSYCPGTSGVDIRLNNSDTGIDYELFFGSTASGAPLNGNGFPLDFGFQTANGVYTVKAIASSGCTSIMNGSASVNALPAPASFTVTGGGSYCPGQPGEPVYLNGSQIGASYQLMHSGAPVGSAMAGTGGSISFGPHTSIGSYTVIATLSPCSVSMTGSAYIAMYPLPVAYHVFGGGSYCAGSSLPPITLSSSQNSTIYELYNGSTFVDTVGGTGGSINFTGIAASGTYSVVALDTTTKCASNMTGTATIMVNMPPTAYTVTGGGSYCAGSAGVHVFLSSSTTGVNYQLYRRSVLVSTAAGIGSRLDFGLETVADTYSVVATNTATGCTNNMSGTTIVSITPTVTPTVAVASSPGDTVCAGSIVSFIAIPTNGGVSPTYIWEVNGSVRASGGSFTYLPVNGDVVSVTMSSSAVCASPATSTQFQTMSVKPNPVISGPTSVCMGTNTVISSAAGCAWSSSVPSVATIATVGSTIGVIVPTSSGTTVITCSLNGCTSSTMITVYALPTVSLGMTAACGGISTLAASGAVSYSWAPASGLSCSSCATTNANPMTSTVYTVTGTNANGCADTATVNVDANRISGYISCGSSLNTFKVTLIQFNATDTSVIAEDSVTSCLNGSSAYYQFSDVPPGDYMVMATLPGQTSPDTTYVPTYSQNNISWASAGSVIHTSNTDTLHINMILGLLQKGNGYIGGNISSTATIGGTPLTPAPGILVYLKDGFGTVLTYTYTNILGNYFFNNLGNGNYIVTPEDFAYSTTPSQTVMLSTAADSAKNVNFELFTTPRLIWPVIANGVKTITGIRDISVYPNPARDLVNIRWGTQPAENTHITIADMLGHTVYASDQYINSSTPMTELDLDLKDGMYVLNIQTGTLAYTCKRMIAH